MDFETLKQNDKRYILNTYSRFDLGVKSGKGSLLYGFDGKEYIDFASGIAVSTFGISDDKWVDEISKQSKVLPHASNLYYTEPSVRLAELLCTKTGMSKVFFSNSGAEANECAIKAARKYSFDRYGIGRYGIVTLKNSFHGRTMATISATGQETFHNYFFPFLNGFSFVEANNTNALLDGLSKGTCAVMLELVQGEGGVNVLDVDYVKEVAEICHDRDILLIIDEVQTGNGRTGSLYAFMQYGIYPDIVTTAKGLGGGLPIGATMFNEKTAGVLSFGTHASTFGANPVCCAGAYSVISRLDDAFLGEVAKKGEYLKSKLKKIKGVKAVSGLGLMLGVSIDGNAKEAAATCLEKGLVVLTAKDKLRLLPALNISYELIDRGIEILNEVLK